MDERTDEHADDHLIVVYTAATEPAAYQLKNVLAEAGIDATVTQTGISGVTATSGADWAAEVVVRQEDAETARRIAREFDARTSQPSEAPQEAPAEAQETPVAAQSPAEASGAWPQCPQCGALRVTRCPACGTTGTHFAQADPEFAGPVVVDQDARPIACSCQGGGCSPQSVSGADEAGPGEVEPPARSEPAPTMLVCPECDEPFLPKYARRCPSCDHRFLDGYDVESEHAARDRMGARTIAVILGLVGLLIAVFVYFASLF